MKTLAVIALSLLSCTASFAAEVYNCCKGELTSWNVTPCSNTTYDFRLTPKIGSLAASLEKGYTLTVILESARRYEEPAAYQFQATGMVAHPYGTVMSVKDSTGKLVSSSEEDYPFKAYQREYQGKYVTTLIVGETRYDCSRATP